MVENHHPLGSRAGVLLALHAVPLARAIPKTEPPTLPDPEQKPHSTDSAAAVPPANKQPAQSKPKRRRRRRIPPELRREVKARRELTAIAGKHRKICASDPSLPLKLVRHYRRQLFGKRTRGRKPIDQVLKAVAIMEALRRDPKSEDWQRIYQECIPGYEKLDYPARRHQADNLRHAAKANRKRKQIRARIRSGN